MITSPLSNTNSNGNCLNEKQTNFIDLKVFINKNVSPELAAAVIKEYLLHLFHQISKSKEKSFHSLIQ